MNIAAPDRILRHPLAVAYRADHDTAAELLRQHPIGALTRLNGRDVTIHGAVRAGDETIIQTIDIGPGAPPRDRRLPVMLPFTDL